MVRQQRGVTALGWLLLLIPVALIVYAGIRLTPVYLNYMKVARTLKQVADEFAAEQINPAKVRTAIERRLDVESVSYPTVQDFVVRRDGSGWVVEIEYEDTAPLFANLSLVASFSESVPIE